MLVFPYWIYSYHLHAVSEREYWIKLVEGLHQLDYFPDFLRDYTDSSASRSWA